jgi:hypothetical protein
MSLQFMTLRRLNLKIQGLPASYAVEPFSSETCIVVGEADQHISSSMYTDSITYGVGHLQPIAPALPADDIAMMGLSAQPPHIMTTSMHMPLEDELVDPNSDSAPSPLPPDLPRSSPQQLLSKSVAVGDDEPLNINDAPIAIDEEKKE